MLQNKLRSMNPNTDCFNDDQPGAPISFRMRLTSNKLITCFALIVACLMFSVDFLTAAQQQRMLEVTLTRHIMAALQQDADKPIDRSLRAHWITPDADGNIDGRISALDTETAEASPIGFLTVTLMEKGREVNKSKTDKDGRFVLEDVDAGIYTLLAFGETGFLAYGVQVLPRLEELDLEDDVLDIDEGVDLNVRNSDRTPLSVKQRRAWYVSHFNLPVDAVIAEELQIDAAAVPPEFSSLEKISRNYVSASSAFSILADKGDLKGIGKADLTSGGFQFPLSPAGHFNGRLQPIATEDGRPAKLSDMNLFLIQDDVEILRVAAEENGEFRMEDVEPGVYSLVAAGKDGFAALSLELVAADEEDAKNAQPGKLDANNIRRVSTAGANPALRQQGPVNVPALGIAIVTDKEDLKMINKTVTRIFDLRQARVGLAQNGPPIGGFNGGNLGGFAPSGFAPGGFAPGGFAPGGFAPSGVASGGFAPGGIASAPASFAPAGISSAAVNAAPLTSGIGSAGLSLGAGPGSILGLAGLAGGVVAIADADDSSEPPPPASPSTTGS